MKSSSNRRFRQRPAHQQEPAREQSFFGPDQHTPFFNPAAALNRAPEEKKEEKVAKAPEEKKEEKVAKAPEEKKEEKLAKAPEEKKEEEKVAKAPEEKKEEKLSKKGEAGGAGESTVRYVEGIQGKGRPLPSAERDYFGARMGYDFSAVQIHTSEEAAQSAKDAQAKAYTYGNHIVFNFGRFDTGSHEGRKLLAHELTHVVQQRPAPAHGQTEGAGPGGPHAAGPASHPTAPGAIHRQLGGTGTVAAPVTPTDRGLFQSRLTLAINQMTTPTVLQETLGGTLEPVLRDMAANAEWIDLTGNSSGGAEVPVRMPRGGRTIRLRLVIDDAATPPMAGTFNSSGADLGIIKVYARENDLPDILATTLYHESLHLRRGLASSAPGGDLVAATGATGGARATLQGIDPSRQPRHVAQVRRRVADLAASVNAGRPATDRVNDSGIDRITNYMMEEYLTRIETEVFRLMRDSDAAARPGVSVRPGIAPDLFFPRNQVDNYLFEYNSVFRASDRAALGSYDQFLIDSLHEYFRDRVTYFVRLRYSEVIHGPTYP